MTDLNPAHSIDSASMPFEVHETDQYEHDPTYLVSKAEETSDDNVSLRRAGIRSTLQRVSSVMASHSDQIH